MRYSWVAALVVIGSCCSAWAQDDAGSDVAGPGPEHQVLKMDAGQWDAEITMNLPGMDQPLKSSGSESSRMVGEYWVVSDLTYDFNGQQMGGHGTFGFDPESRRYVGFWHGSDVPYVMHMDGQYDEASKTMTYQFEGKDPTGAPVRGKTVTRYIDDDHKTFELHFEMGEQTVKMMEIAYTRK